MAREFGESASREPQNSFCSGSSNSGNGDAGSFECDICFELPLDPIVTLCGHLYCWPCLYQWLHGHAHSSECPVCKAFIEEDKLVPLYGRGKTSTFPTAPAGNGLRQLRRLIRISLLMHIRSRNSVISSHMKN